jgi:hypothetical protein
MIHRRATIRRHGRIHRRAAIRLRNDLSRAGTMTALRPRSKIRGRNVFNHVSSNFLTRSAGVSPANEREARTKPGETLCKQFEKLRACARRARRPRSQQ